MGPADELRTLLRGGGLSHGVGLRALGSERCRGARVSDFELHVGEQTLVLKVLLLLLHLLFFLVRGMSTRF